MPAKDETARREKHDVPYEPIDHERGAKRDGRESPDARNMPAEFADDLNTNRVNDKP
jgi:hypothetical protein